MTFLQRLTAKRQDDLERIAEQRGLVLVEPSGFNRGDIVYWSMARPAVTDEMVAAASAVAVETVELDDEDVREMLEAALST